MAYTTAAGGEFEPNKFAVNLIYDILPAQREGDPEAVYRRLGLPPPDRQAETAALAEASSKLAPPENAKFAGDMYALLMGMVALQASGEDYLKQFPNPVQRYTAATGWVCENFSWFVWWDCDRH